MLKINYTVAFHGISVKYIPHVKELVNVSLISKSLCPLSESDTTRHNLFLIMKM